MIKLIKSLLTLSIILARFYCIFMVGYGLYLNRANNEPLDNIQWYVYILVLDLYCVKIFDNSIDSDIYSEKDNGKEVIK
jgi:hypothetical protein